MSARRAAGTTLLRPASVGVSVPKLEGYDKVTGRARYVDDLRIPGMLHGRTVRSTIPRGRVATPEEIAGPVVYLASDLANHVVGAVLNVNGGSVLFG